MDYRKRLKRSLLLQLLRMCPLPTLQLISCFFLPTLRRDFLGILPIELSTGFPRDIVGILPGHHSVREKIETRIKKKNIKFNLPSSLMQTASTIDPNKVQTIIMEDLDYPFIQFSLDLRDSSYHLDTSSKPTDNGGSCKSAPCKIHISRVPGSRSGWIHPSLTDPRRHVVQYGTHT
jgi:hypothetical protein